MAGPDANAFKRRMDGALDAFKRELSGLRTGRASPSLLESVAVDAYGAQRPINQLGTVSVPEPRLLTVQVWDKGLVKSVEKAIREAGLGVNPQVDGQTIRVPIPDLSQERRQELAKLAAKCAEQARVAVRNVRRDAMESLKKMEKDGEISQDEHRSWSTRMQKMTDEHIKIIDDTYHAKEKEILHV